MREKAGRVADTGSPAVADERRCQLGGFHGDDNRERTREEAGAEGKNYDVPPRPGAICRAN